MIVIDFLRIVVGVLLAASLATIVAYAVVFLSVAAWTVLSHRGSPRDSLADELDEFLAGLWAADSGRVPGDTRHARGSW